MNPPAMSNLNESLSFQPEASMPRCPQFPCKTRGVGLIEVMVAILVLAVGLLGIAALQATTLRSSQGSLERSQAVIQTYGILDSMRANTAAAAGGAYTIGMTCVAPAAGTLALSDLRAWIQGFQAELGANACGQIEPRGGGLYRITIQWQDQRGVNTQNLQTVSTL